MKTHPQLTKRTSSARWSYWRATTHRRLVKLTEGPCDEAQSSKALTKNPGKALRRKPGDGRPQRATACWCSLVELVRVSNLGAQTALVESPID